MGIKKSSRRLLKLGRQAARELGEGGRDFVDTVFRTAIQVELPKVSHPDRGR